MSDIDALVAKIIPPATRDERDGFCTRQLLSSLNKTQAKAVEERLIEMLSLSNDTLLATSLIWLNAKSAIPAFKKRIELSTSPSETIRWARFVYELDSEEKNMEAIAFDAFQQTVCVHCSDGVLFYDLVVFKSDRINDRIKTFVKHKTFLISYHAKRALKRAGITDFRIAGAKRWWEFWK